MLERILQKKQTCLRITSLSLLGVFFVSLFVTLVIPVLSPDRASALTTVSDKTTDLDWQVQSWWYARTIEGCYKNASKEPDAVKVAAGQLFYGGGSTGSMWGSYMENALPSVINDDGWGVCGGNNGEVSKAALNHWGIDGLTLVCSSQMQSQGVYTKASGQACNDPADGGFGNIDGNKAAKGFMDYIQAMVYKGAPIPSATGTSLSKPLQYTFWGESLLRACTSGSPSPTSPSGVSPNTVFSIATGSNPVVQGVYAPTTVYTYYTASTGLTRDSPRHALPADQQTKCADMEVKANAAYAGADGYAEFVASNPTAAIDLGSGTGVTDDEGLNPCAALDGDGLRWITCPLLLTANGLTSWLESILMELLYYDVGIFDRSLPQGKAMYAAWSSFRNIGMALIVIAALVMIVSQVIGTPLLDAYTIKKVMPRLLIATIGLALSWYLIGFVVGLFNDLGGLVQNIILQPFIQNMPSSQMNGFEVTGSVLAGIFTAALGGTAIFAWTAISAPGALLALVGTTVLALFIGLLVIGLRTVIITLCIILAPLAIAAFILPSTERFWKFWWKTFWTVLMVYVTVVAFLAAGRAMALVTDNTLFAVIFIIASWFSLIFAFKLAGGVFAAVTQGINNQSRGIFDRSRKFRQEANARKGQRIMENREKTGTGVLGSMRSATYGGYRRGKLLEQTGFSRAKYDAEMAKINTAASAESVKGDAGHAAGDDPTLALLTNPAVRNEREFIAAYTRTVPESNADTARAALAKAEVGFNAEIGSNALRVAALNATSTSSTALESGEEGVIEFVRRAKPLVDSGVISRDQAIAMIKQNRARQDLSGMGWGVWQPAFDRISGEIQNGPVGATNADIAAIQRPDDATSIGNSIADASYTGSAPGDIVRGHTRSAAAMVSAGQRALQRAINEGNETNIQREMAKIAGIYDQMSSATMDVQQVFAGDGSGVGPGAGLMDYQVTIGDQTHEVRTFIDAYSRRSPAFLQARREYSSAAEASTGSHEPPRPDPAAGA